MKHIAAYLLAVLGGNPNPDDKAIKAILSAAGIEADPARIQKLLTELKGKDLADILAKGRTKLASVPAGGSATTTTAAATPGAETKKGGKDDKKEDKKEKKKEEKKEEEEEEGGDMGFGLFD